MAVVLRPNWVYNIGPWRSVRLFENVKFGIQIWKKILPSESVRVGIRKLMMMAVIRKTCLAGALV